MKLYCDGCCDGSVVAALRAAGHAVGFAAESGPAGGDDDVLARAAREGSLLVTEDKDFSELVVRLRKPCVGLLLVRFPNAIRHLKAAAVVDLVNNRGMELLGSATTLSPSGSRRRRLPADRD